MQPDQIKKEKERKSKVIREERIKIVGIIDEICEKEIEALTEPNKAFLRARVSYLTGDQVNKFAEVLKSKAKPVKPPVDPNRVSYKALQQKAKSLGLPYRNISKPDLEVAISTTEGPAGAPKPE